MGVKMDSKKTLHIDTLYLSYNCDFEAYLEALDIIADKPLAYYRDGRHFYDFGYARVGHLDWEICQKSNNYPFVVEYNFEYLYQTDLLSDWKQIELPFGDCFFEQYLIKRIDYNITFQEKDCELLQKIFVSPYFQKPWLSLDGSYNTETVNLGYRKTGKGFRLYNKTKELSDKKNFIKCDMLRNTFGSLDNLYSLEVEILRKYILSRTDSKGRLCDFEAVVELAKHLLGSIKYCDWTEKNLKLMRSKNYNKITFDYIEKYVGDIEFKSVKKYQKSTDGLLKVVDNLISQFNAYDGSNLSFDDLAKLVSMRDKQEYVDYITEGKIFNNYELEHLIKKL